MVSPSRSASTETITGVPGSSRLRLTASVSEKDDGFELPGRVRKCCECELVALLGATLAGSDDDAGEAPGRCAALNQGLEFAEAFYAELGQYAVILIERVAGEIEADGLEFFRKLLHRGPRRGRPQNEIGGLASRTEEIGRALAASDVRRCAEARIVSALAVTRARLEFSASKAPPLASVSIARLLSAFASTRAAKSPREV